MNAFGIIWLLTVFTFLAASPDRRRESLGVALVGMNFFTGLVLAIGAVS